MQGPNRSNNTAATITRYALILLGLILLALMVYRVLTIVEVIYISLIIAATLHPIAVSLQRWVPRPIALIAIYLILISISILLGIVIIPPLVLQLGSFLALVPEQAQQIRGFLGDVDYWLATAGVPINLENVVTQITGQIGGLTVRLIQIPLLIYEVGASLFAIVTLSFYWLIDRERLIASLISLLPADHRGRARIIYLRSEHRLGSFVRGLMVASVILGILTYVGLNILGVPFPLLLALIAAIFEVIPIIGPVIAAVPIIGLAFTKSIGVGIATAIFWVGVQQFEGYVITPIVQRESVRLAPFMILVSILVGGALLGILGALLAIPTAVLIGILLYELSPVHRHRDDEDPP